MPDRQKEIIAMFDSISSTYDVTNRIISMGADHGWRRAGCHNALKMSETSTPAILDVACGTGAMIQHWMETAQELGVAIQSISGVDPSEGMLSVAKEKLPQHNFYHAEAKALPVETDSVDIISIAYGIRNVVDRSEAFAEFRRALKPGGLLVILEFVQQDRPTLMQRASGFYTAHLLPLIGGLVSKNYRAYKYLPESIKSFPKMSALFQELENSGFSIEHQQGYLGGASTLLICKS